MKPDSPIQLTRLSLLLQKLWIYNSRTIITTVISTIGVMFLLLYAVQIVTQFKTWTPAWFMSLYVWLYMIVATVVGGSSFSGLRSNQRAYSYFLTPASIPEKFIFEFTFRVVLFTILFPLIYWLVFHVEGYLVEWIEPAFTFQPVTFFDAFHLPTKAENSWMKLFVFSQGLLFLTIPFFGTTYFQRHPILKTVAWAAGILFLHLILYFLVQRSDIRLFPSRVTGLYFMTFYVLAINITMIVLAYLQLKSKQY